MTTSYYKLYKTEVDNDYFWIKNESNFTSVIQLYVNGENYDYVTENVISSSKDKVNWNNTETTLGGFTLEPYQKMYLRSSGGFSKSASNYIQIISNSIFSLGGPIASLIDYTDMQNVTSVPDWCFYNLCSSDVNYDNGLSQKYLVDISQIDFGNITTIGEGSFSMAFYVDDSSQGSSYIKTLPDFSKRTTIGRSGMSQMFSGASILTGKLIMPNLTSVGEYGLDRSFQYTNLTELDFSSLTTIGYRGLYSAFKYNYNMKGQPLMSNLTTIGNFGMYECFLGDEYITKGADLSSCTEIGDYALYKCYSECYNLEEVTAPNVDYWYTGEFQYWLNDAGIFVSGTKTFNAPTGLDIPTGPGGIPSGWTRVDY